jgi:site-specific recombinase XerD
MNEDNMSTGGPGRAEAVASHKRFIDTIRADPDRSKGTEDNYRRALRHLIAVAPMPPEELNDDHITAFRERLDKTFSTRTGKLIEATTVNVAIAGLRSYLNWARRGDLLGHPGLKVRRDRRDRKRMRREWTLSSEEDVTLMMGCHQVASTSVDPSDVRNHAMVLFLLTTGLRIGEALDLRWRDLDLEKGTVHVRKGKGGKERTALMDPRTAEVMARLRDLGHMKSRSPIDQFPGSDAWGDETHRSFSDDDPVFCGARPLEQMCQSNANSFIKKIARSHTGKEYTAHCFRHTFCTRFLRHGKTLQDLETLMELAGHSSIMTTQGYLDLDGKIRDERFARVTEAHWATAERTEVATVVQQEEAPPEATEICENNEPPLEGPRAVDRAPTLLDWS